MIRKAFMIALLLCYALIFPDYSDAEYVMKEYEFVWHVVSVGDVDIKVQKTPKRLGVLLSSRGGKIATLFLEPIQAITIGEVLLKSEDYRQKLIGLYKQQVKGFEKDMIETVRAGGHKVIFSLTEKGRTFEIKIMAPKIFSPAVLVAPAKAGELGKFLLEAQILADQVDKRVRP